jgi:hypothetical protein
MHFNMGKSPKNLRVLLSNGQVTRKYAMGAETSITNKSAAAATDSQNSSKRSACILLVLSNRQYFCQENLEHPMQRINKCSHRAGGVPDSGQPSLHLTSTTRPTDPLFLSGCKEQLRHLSPPRHLAPSLALASLPLNSQVFI